MTRAAFARSHVTLRPSSELSFPGNYEGLEMPHWRLVGSTKWLHDVKAAIPPDFEQGLSSASSKSGHGAEDLKRAAESASAVSAATAKPARRGATIQANLTPQQQALLGRKANDCMEVLAFMDQGNIIPR